MFCEMVGSVLDEEIEDLLDYCHLIKHPHHKTVRGGAFDKELSCLVQGFHGIVKGTDTLNLIFPADTFEDITYVCIISNTGQKRRIRIDAESPSAAI